METSQLAPDQRQRLSHQSAEAYEARLFAESHPDFVQCTFNSQRMMDYVTDHKLPLTAPSFEKAFKALSKQFKLWPSPSVMATMSPEELRKLAQEIGIERFDARGRSVGFDWPEGIAQLQEKAAREYSHTRTVSDCRPPNPRLIGYKPTKKEFASWNADMLTAWMSANDLTELPQYLRER
jgi:hypothetical protein